MRKLFYLIALLSLIVNLASPTVLYSASSPNLYTGNTVGLIVNDSLRAWPGYTLVAPKHYTSLTYLLDNQGQVVHTWTGTDDEPGQSAYLLENGNLLRAAKINSQLGGTGGGEGGRIEEYDWNSNKVWSMDYSTTTYMQHHDFCVLPNGNIIMLVVEKQTYAEAVESGFNPGTLGAVLTDGFILPDTVVEIRPNRAGGWDGGGTVVWKWKIWDHLIQEFDATKGNYGDVSAHPELVDPNGSKNAVPVFWNHMNSITYNPAFDQIMLSVRGNSEIMIIDHSTTTAEAAGHTGGIRGKGGDLLYRWGNPSQYGAGSNQKLFQQHCAMWIPPGYPGAGDITVYNNGLSRNYSSVDQFTPPVDDNGTYISPVGDGIAFGPSNLTWTYTAIPPTSMYDGAISGAQRLPNGNTLIDSGTHGRFIEVNSAGETVWEYINPTATNSIGILGRTDTIPGDAREGEFANGVFRVLRYPADYAGLAGRDLTPGGSLEKSNFAFTVTKGGASPAGQILSIKNTGIGTLNWTVSTPSYIIASPASGSSTGEIDNVTLTLNMSEINNMTTGIWNDNFTVAASGATTSPQKIPVKVTILPSSDKTITVTQGANGTISPGTTIVPFGGNQTFNIAANSGYHIANVLVDGSSVGAVASYTFTNVTANHTLTAVFLSGTGNGGVGPCNEATIISATYTVSKGGTANETITNVPPGTVKATFLAALSKGESHQTWNDAGINDPVVTGNTLVVTAEDTTTVVTYTVTVTTVLVPTITSVSPAIGSLNGGLSVTITGTNFLGPATVTFDTTAVTATVVSATTITCTSPAHAAATVNVSVTTSGGTATKTSAFIYKAATEVPSITSVTPNNGPIAGGTSVTITGGKLGGTVLALTFNDVSATSIVVDPGVPGTTPAFIKCTTPASVTSGLAKINLTTNAGSTTNTTAFTYIAPVTYTVTYNGNVNDSGTVPTDGNSPYNSGATVTVLGNTGGLARTGYSFNNWNTLAGGGGTSYAAGNTFSISANTTLYAQWTASTANVNITVTLQGGSRTDTGWVVPLTVKFFTPGSDVMTGSPLYTFNLTTTKSGSTAIATASGITFGTYDISAVTPHCLTNVKTGNVIAAPSAAVDLGTLLEGNADDSNVINITDFGILAASYGKSSGDSGYEANADFDCSGTINITDFGLLAANYGKSAPVVP